MEKKFTGQMYNVAVSQSCMTQVLIQTASKMLSQLINFYLLLAVILQ